MKIITDKPLEELTTSELLDILKAISEILKEREENNED